MELEKEWDKRPRPCAWDEVEDFISCALDSQMSDLRKEITKNWKNERNMAKGKYQLETVGEVYAWNYVLDEVLLLMKAGEDK